MENNNAVKRLGIIGQYSENNNGKEAVNLSELIDNRKHRQETLKGIIRDIHAGASPDDIKERFAELLDQVGPTEISEIEQALIDEGLPIEEVQSLCDVHVSVFRDSLERQLEAEAALGDTRPKEHPINMFKDENKMITSIVDAIKSRVEEIGHKQPGEEIGEDIREWRKMHTELGVIGAHYTRKENVLFPYLERNSISGPPSVMWGIHDEIRAGLKDVSKIIQEAETVANPQLSREIADVVVPLLNQISEMVYKEENILFPMCIETLTEDEWEEIRGQLLDPTASQYHKRNQQVNAEQSSPNDGLISLEVGSLTRDQINLMLTHLPVDITYVDENDEVRYFSLGPERIFDRAPAVIGRKVQNCHPPSSVHVVNDIVSDFRSGKRDHADFWINANGELIYIRYFAVRDKSGQYRGTIEVSQNVTEIQKLTGEKRIYDEEVKTDHNG